MSKSSEPKMPRENGEYLGQSIDILGRETLHPASGWTPFWKPRFALSSPELSHLPFLFWLVENHAPTRVVQLGVGDGVAYLGVCQAIDKLGLNAACRGISISDTAEENGEAQAYNTQHYKDFSKLSFEKLGTAHRHYRKGGIDLLIVNTPLDAATADVLANKWNALLSERAVVVILNSQQRMKDEGADSWLDPLIESYPAIELEQDDGLLALTVGAQQDGRIARLADLELGMAGYHEARQIFSTLGDSLVATQAIADFKQAHQKDSAALSDTRTKLAKAEEEMSKARAGEEDAHEQLADLQAKSFDLKLRCESLEKDLAKAQSRSADLEGELSRLRAEFDGLVRERETISAANTALESKVDQGQNQCERLTIELSESRERLEDTEAKLSKSVALEETLAAIEAQRDDARQERDSLRKDLEEAQSHTDRVEQLEAAHTALEGALSEAQEKLAKSEQTRADTEGRLGIMATEWSAKEERLKEKWVEAQSEYRERLVDISELGHAIAAKEIQIEKTKREISQWRSRVEESELRCEVMKQLGAMRAQLHAGLARKPKLGKANPALKKVEEEVNLVRANEKFDARWYLAFYPDVAEAGADPARHFVTDGAYELRNPGPEFDSLKYHKAFPDVAKAQIAAFIHYVRYGEQEKREIFPVGERG